MIHHFVELRPGVRSAGVAAILPVEVRWHVRVPLAGAAAPCGFPSPADDYLDKPLDFNELLIQNPAATFAVRIAGQSMIGAGLFPNDIAVVDRSASSSSSSCRQRGFKAACSTSQTTSAPNRACGRSTH